MAGSAAVEVEAVQGADAVEEGMPGILGAVAEGQAGAGGAVIIIGSDVIVAVGGDQHVRVLDGVDRRARGGGQRVGERVVGPVLGFIAGQDGRQRR